MLNIVPAGSFRLLKQPVPHSSNLIDIIERRHIQVTLKVADQKEKETQNLENRGLIRARNEDPETLIKTYSSVF